MKESANKANKLKKMKQTLVFIFHLLEPNTVLADCSTHRKMDRKIEQMTDIETVSKFRATLS